MLKQRIITAAVLIPLVILGIFYLPLPWFNIIAAAILLWAAWEWGQLIGLSREASRWGYLLITILVFLLFHYLPAVVILPLAIITWAVLTYLVFNYQQFIRFWSSSFWLRVILGWWVLGLAWYGLVFIRAQALGAGLLLLLLLWVWGADIGAYFCGRRWGKHKLAPQISPGKSIEGLAGGLLVTLLIGAIAGVFFSPSLAYYISLLILALLVALISVIGDLFESMLKRQAGVKDSGQLLPGHGGILDRIDSLLSAAPVFAAGMLLLTSRFH